jgi:hypothetical protein
MTDTVAPQNIHLSSWITLYMSYYKFRHKTYKKQTQVIRNRDTELVGRLFFYVVFTVHFDITQQLMQQVHFIS